MTARPLRVAPDVVGDVMPGLVALERELFGDDAWDETALRDLIGTSGRRLTVWESTGLEGTGLVEGYALTGMVGDFAELLRIAVAPTARRSGLAGALLGDAATAAVAAGADRMLLEVSETNTGARAFYERVGFVEIARRPAYYRDRSAALVLQLDLGQGRMEP